MDNVEVARTSWKPCTQQAWDQRFSIQLEKSRELELSIYWKDWRSLCAVKFLKLEEFIDDVRHGMALELEPQGLLFAEVRTAALVNIGGRCGWSVYSVVCGMIIISISC